MFRASLNAVQMHSGGDHASSCAGFGVLSDNDRISACAGMTDLPAGPSPFSNENWVARYAVNLQVGARNDLVRLGRARLLSSRICSCGATDNTAAPQERRPPGWPSRPDPSAFENSEGLTARVPRSWSPRQGRTGSGFLVWDSGIRPQIRKRPFTTKATKSAKGWSRKLSVPGSGSR